MTTRLMPTTGWYYLAPEQLPVRITKSMDLSFLLAIAVVTVSAVTVVRILRAPDDVDKADHPERAAVEDAKSPKPEVQDSIFEIADRLEDTMDKSSHPSDVLDNKDFKAAVAMLNTDRYTKEQTVNFALGANWVLSCVALEALKSAEPDAGVVDRALANPSNFYAWPLYFLVDLVERNGRDTDLVRLLCCAQRWWQNNDAIVGRVSKLVNNALERGVTFKFEHAFEEVGSSDLATVKAFTRSLSGRASETLGRALEAYARTAIDKGFLGSIGSIVGTESPRDVVFETAQTRHLKSELFEQQAEELGRSILLVGESGVGKSAFATLLSNHFAATGWTLLRTSASSLIADKKYIGEIEGQVRKLSTKATVQKRVVILVEDVAEFRLAGRHKNSERSILDQLWPHLVSRQVFLIGETTPAGFQAMAREHPTLSTVWRVVQIRPATDTETRELATELLDKTPEVIAESRTSAVINEAMQLSQQYLSHKSWPGSVLSLLKNAVLRAQNHPDGDHVSRSHVLAALSQISGLPKEVLDERQVLDIEALRASFRAKVIGQDEAVDCLVERIAMLKAGLVDPSRPIGVFLFAGPTGTGKTEIAKTLATMLFGAEEQMIRLDMSEFQDQSSLSRLVGSSDLVTDGGSLVEKIRERPFSIVLLDEFEKAHARIWDLFLQVFDDGRMTDTSGRLADFRHSIIILTSNLGATISNEAGIGFTSKSGVFSANDVMRVVNRTFRREFVNRLDRVVVFSPLGRDVMRVILQNELQKALNRRGFRGKQWAVEMEDSATEFLLSEGFTHDLGARPLRRAIEKYLLAPLSIEMVQNLAPTGEQFLFVRSNGLELSVEFIDPDADIDVADNDNAEYKDSQLSLPRLMYVKQLPAGARAFLESQVAEVRDRITSSEWSERKAEYLAELNTEGFWDNPERHGVLDRIELIDRVDTATSTLKRLIQRLRDARPNRSLVSSIASRLYVVKEGILDFDLERPTQAYLGLRLVSGDLAMTGSDAFLHDLNEMYVNWFKARGMRFEALNASTSRYDVLYKISGFGSFGILAPESGLHVFEIPTGESQFDRVRARVQVAGVPLESPVVRTHGAHDPTDVLDRSAGKVEVVRRYRRVPSPLVRDNARHWRSGKLDLVYQGFFDILGHID